MQGGVLCVYFKGLAHVLSFVHRLFPEGMKKEAVTRVGSWEQAQG